MKLTSDQKSVLKKKLLSAVKDLKKEAIVYSVYSLSHSELNSLKTALKNKYGEVEITNKLDSQILGGLIVEVDSQRINLSLSDIINQ